MLASRELSEFRMQVCKSCEYYARTTGTCGTLGVGQNTPYGRTCGCVMAVKTRIAASKCPLSKWGRQCSDIDFRRAKDWLHENDSKRKLNVAEVRELAEYITQLSGKKRGATMCTPCVADMKKELKLIIDNAL